MRETEENIKFKMEIDVLVPIPRTVTRDFTSLKHLRQWQKRNDIDGSLYCFCTPGIPAQRKGRMGTIYRYRQTGSNYRRIGKTSFGYEAKGVQPIQP